MDALRDALLILHLIGLAAILGPFLDQLRAQAQRITQVMLWGARAQIITGLGLVGVAVASDADLDHVKIAVKFVVALAIAGVAETGIKRDAPRAFWLAIGILTFLNVVVAVVWR